MELAGLWTSQSPTWEDSQGLGSKVPFAWHHFHPKLAPAQENESGRSQRERQ